MEEDDWYQNTEPDDNELEQLMENINEPGQYGNTGENDFHKGQNPREKGKGRGRA